MTVVVNASPLIILGKAGLLHLLPGIADRVCIPASVAAEIAIGEDTVSDWLRQKDQESYIIKDPLPDPFVLGWDLGAGETAVLSLRSDDADTFRVLDDRAARRCAECMTLRVVGTVGLILMAKKSGLLITVSEALDAVVRAGLFIAPRHLDLIREAAGETS